MGGRDKSRGKATEKGTSQSKLKKLKAKVTRVIKVVEEPSASSTKKHTDTASGNDEDEQQQQQDDMSRRQRRKETKVVPGTRVVKVAATKDTEVEEESNTSKRQRRKEKKALAGRRDGDGADDNDTKHREGSVDTETNSSEQQQQQHEHENKPQPQQQQHRKQRKKNVKKHRGSKSLHEQDESDGETLDVLGDDLNNNNNNNNDDGDVDDNDDNDNNDDNNGGGLSGTGVGDDDEQLNVVKIQSKKPKNAFAALMAMGNSDSDSDSDDNDNDNSSGDDDDDDDVDGGGIDNECNDHGIDIDNISFNDDITDDHDANTKDNNNNDDNTNTNDNTNNVDVLTIDTVNSVDTMTRECVDAEDVKEDGAEEVKKYLDDSPQDTIEEQPIVDQEQSNNNDDNYDNCNDDDNDEEEEEEWIEVEDVWIPNWEESLFDGHVSKSFEDTMTYMSTTNSFFVPNKSHLNNRQGLFAFLQEKICRDFTCISCHKVFYSLEAVRGHMKDVSHQKINIEKYETIVDLAPFYDNTIITDAKKPRRPQSTRVNAAGGLVLASGAQIGHRSMKRYFKQAFRPGHCHAPQIKSLEEKRMIRKNAKKTHAILLRSHMRDKGMASKAIASTYAHKADFADNAQNRAVVHHWGAGGGGSHYNMCGSRQYQKGVRVKGVVLRHSRQGAKLQAARNKANRANASSGAQKGKSRS